MGPFQLKTLYLGFRDLGRSPADRPPLGAAGKVLGWDAWLEGMPTSAMTPTGSDATTCEAVLVPLQAPQRGKSATTEVKDHGLVTGEDVEVETLNFWFWIGC